MPAGMVVLLVLASILGCIPCSGSPHDRHLEIDRTAAGTHVSVFDGIGDRQEEKVAGVTDSANLLDSEDTEQRRNLEGRVVDVGPSNMSRGVGKSFVRRIARRIIGGEEAFGAYPYVVKIIRIGGVSLTVGLCVCLCVSICICCTYLSSVCFSFAVCVHLGLDFRDCRVWTLISLLFLPSHLHRLLLSFQLPHTNLPSLYVISAH